MPKQNPTSEPLDWWQPEAGLTWQWQLTGKLDLDLQSDVIDIDLEVGKSVVDYYHAKDTKVICYISVGSYEKWRSDADQFPEEVLGNKYEGWSGERWLDIRRIDLLAPIMLARLDECAEKGFDAIEPDNMEIYTNNTGFPLTYDDQLHYALWLAEESHKRGLAIAQKNAPDQTNDLVEVYDFAITEDAFYYGWAEDMLPYIQAGKPVFAAEYTDQPGDFEEFCRQSRELGFSTILKNRDLDGWVEMCILTSVPEENAMIPADVFDLNHWKITLPLDEDNDGRVDEIDVAEISSYSHPDYFYLDENAHMVFASPNRATTTANSSNTRSELRQMLRGTNRSIGTSDPGNNFSLAAHENASDFGAIGGKMEATLRVDHVAINAEYSDKYPVYSVVVGQIHAGKSDDNSDGFGWGNEPLKIYYKKFPDHDYGSVFWTYERNLAKEDPNRTDIAYPVWGNIWDNSDDPGAEGIALGEEFSYVVNVYDNTLYLTFETKNHDTAAYQIDLSNNVDAYGNVDSNDFPQGYSGDSFYFKAGAYDQCNVNTDEGFWYTACDGSGIWETDYANGDYVQVTFSNLVLSDAERP